MNERVRTYLIEIARKKDKFIFYSELVKDCALEFDLATPDGQRQLKEILTDISRYENSYKRPMLTSIAIGKKDNDHGNGFYELAEEFGFGKNKELHTRLWGIKEEAVRTREYWQNEDHYKQFARANKGIASIQSLLENLFTDLIESDYYHWVENWKSDYINFVIDVKRLQRSIRQNPGLTIDNIELYRLLSAPIQSYESFMRKWMKEKANGISSRGQSVLSEDNFGKIINDETFKIIVRTVINDPTLKSFNLLTQWWYSNEAITNRPLLINRAFAVCNPENLSSTVDNKKFWTAIQIFRSKYGFNFTEDPQGNWFAANEQLTTWLNIQLDSVLQKKSTDKLEQLVWRNIFVWLVYDKFNPEYHASLPPNQLIERNKPKDGFENMPEFERTFKGVNIDFQGKAKEQKDLGDAGEELVKQHEIRFLTEKRRIKEAQQVKIVKDGEGYDIYSFDEFGNEIFIEVKTTTGNGLTPFFLTENEISFMRKHSGKYHLYRVYNYDEENNSGEFFRMNNDIESQLLMIPTQYKVLIKRAIQ